MWKCRFLFGLSAGFLARSDDECCGADCKPSFSASDSPAPGCNTEQTILHAGLHVTQADTMPLPTIFQHGYEEMFNASCASGFQHQRSNLSVTTVVYDCEGLCPESDYGSEIFQACCNDCAARDTVSLLPGHEIVAFAFCKGCPREDETEPETQSAFNRRVHATLHTQVTAWINGGWESVERTSHVFGSVHDGAWQTDVTSGQIPSGLFPDSGLAVVLPGETNEDRLPLASATATVAGPPADERRLQHMFENSYGYNTRCAAAIPGTCDGTFQLKLVNCNDCQDVPILKRACCRDCGCALAQEALTVSGGGNHVHLQCAGCGCADATTGIEAWANHYVGNCTPLHARVSARYYVHGDIPITFQSPGDVSTNPAFNLAIGEAIAEIAHADVPASAVTVTFQQARRLESEESARRLSGVVYANYTIEVPSEASARTARAHIEAQTTDTAQEAINHHLSNHNLPIASEVGDFHSTPLGAAGAPQAALLSAPVSAPPSVQETAVQASSQENPSPTTRTSGSWLPALLGIAVALGLAVFAIVCFLNSAEAPKKRSKRGLSLSPGPTPRQVSAPKPSVQPTTSTVLPMTQLQPPVLQLSQQLAPAQAIRLPQQSMIPVYR